MMPKMTGIELLTALHRKGIVLPTIVTSGYYKYEAFEKWLSDEQIPCREKFLFLEKPFRFEEVKMWIDGILKGNT
jgi:FixJ family two-component response regulator